ncbi:MAG: hypothetical protein JXR83_12410 [Deltaproteobacteria bacterium]|nr:hypothetical protein [Deltaproteobacteria bacterium]
MGSALTRALAPALSCAALLLGASGRPAAGPATAEAPERRAARIADLLRQDCSAGAILVEGHELLTPALERQLKRCCRTGSAAQQRVAIAALGRLVSAGHKRLVSDLVVLFRQATDDDIRVAALLALGDQAPPGLLPQLLELYRRQPPGDSAVLAHIGRLGRGKDLIAIADRLGADLEISVFDPGSPAVQAVQQLIDRDDQTSVGHFRQRWPALDRRRRLVALLVFGGARELAAMPLITGLLTPLDDEDPQNQRLFEVGFWTLARISNRAALDQLRAFAFGQRDPTRVQRTTRVHPNVRPEYAVQVRAFALRALVHATPRRDCASLASEILAQPGTAYGSVADANWAAAVEIALRELEQRYGAPLP